MKNIIVLICLFLFYATSFSQSPQVTVSFRLEELMSHGDTCASVYTIKQKQCEFPRNPVKQAHDTSSIDWNNIPDSLFQRIKCDEYNSVTKKSYVIEYIFDRIEYAFEKIYTFIISRIKCGKSETMEIKFPVKIRSFFTTINLGKIYFVPGKYDISEKLEYSLTKNDFLQITLPENSLPDY